MHPILYGRDLFVFNNLLACCCFLCHEAKLFRDPVFPQEHPALRGFSWCIMGRQHCTALQLSVRGLQLAGASPHCPQLLPCWGRLWQALAGSGFWDMLVEEKIQCKGIRKEKWEKAGSCQSKGVMEKHERTSEERKRGRSWQKESSLFFTYFLFFLFHKCFSPLHFLLSIPSFPPAPTLASLLNQPVIQQSVYVQKWGVFWIQKGVFRPPG